MNETYWVKITYASGDVDWIEVVQANELDATLNRYNDTKLYRNVSYGRN